MFLYSYVVIDADGIITFHQQLGLALKDTIEKAKKELEICSSIVNDDKRWVDPKKGFEKFIIQYVDSIGVKRTFSITHTNMADAITVFDKLIWRDVDYRIGVTIKVGV